MPLLNRLSIKSKLILMLLVVSLGSIFTIAYLGYRSGKSNLTTRVFNQLTSLRSAKAYQIEAYFETIRNHYLQIQLESEPPAIQQTDEVLGIDVGRTDIAVTSKGEKFSGKQITQVRDKYSRVRASLQQKASKGTRSTRRRARQVLQRLSGRERRFQAWLNHTISYRLVQQAKNANQSIALEDLTGIRERTNEMPRSKTERRRSNSWAFYQLRQFLTYKGVKFGIDVRLVDPRYTSKTCHCCKVIGHRQGKRFECLNEKCGWIGDADVNGAKNIAALGQLVNLPELRFVLSK